jgi:hypothetical protein
LLLLRRLLLLLLLLWSLMKPHLGVNVPHNLKKNN